MSALTEATQAQSGNKIANLIRQQIGQALAVAGLVVIFAFFSIANPVFYSWPNLSGILMSTTVTGMLAIG